MGQGFALCAPRSRGWKAISRELGVGVSTVVRNAHATVEELQAAILAEVEEFSRGTTQADDVTLLILRFPGREKAGRKSSSA